MIDDIIDGPDKVCRTCRWWTTDDPKKWGFCEKISHGVFRTVYIFQADGPAKLATMGSFGCNQWEYAMLGEKSRLGD